MAVEKTCEEELLELGINPIVDRIDELCRPTINEILNTIDNVHGEMVVDFDGFRSHETYIVRDQSGGREIRSNPVSNLEVSFSSFQWIDTEFTLDMRKDLPEQVSKQLRDRAAKMLEAAEAIDEIDDHRSLTRIVALIGIVPPQDAQ